MTSAAQPTQTTVTTQDSLEIAYPQYQYVPINTGFTLYIHVYNSSRYLTGTMAECYLDLYNSLGVETCHNKMTAGVSDYYIPISKSNFSNLGTHSFVIQCNTSTQTGFANGVFTVTTTGTDENTNTTFFAILIIFAVIILILAFIFDNEILSFISGISFLSSGVYSMIYGFEGVTTDYTRMISIIIIGIGMIITIVSSFDFIEDMSGGDSDDSDFNDDD